MDDTLQAAIDRAARRIAAALLTVGMMLAAKDIPSGQASTIYDEVLDRIGGVR